MSEVIYRKRGRRYEPVGVYQELDIFHIGAHLIVVEPGCTSTHRQIDPDYAGVEAALRVAQDAMVREMVDESKLRMPSGQNSERSRRAYEAWAAIMGEGAFVLERASAVSIVEAGINAVRARREGAKP